LLAVTATCHLALGRVNTAQMVAEGCTEILCFSTQSKDIPDYANNIFPKELVERCSAAFRNLSIAIPNQADMVEVGAIECIVELNNMHEDAAGHLSVVQTHRNCASALRSMTYNIDIRQHLVTKGAIIVILNDLTRINDDDHDNTIGIDLLCELEAESWCNGSRGKAKEARAPPLTPSGLYTQLLGGVSNVSLDVDKVRVDQHKFLVRVNLEEPPIATTATREKLQDGFSNLASYTDADQTFTPFLMQYGKQPHLERGKRVRSAKGRSKKSGPRGSRPLTPAMESHDDEANPQHDDDEEFDMHSEQSLMEFDDLSLQSTESRESEDTISEVVRPLRIINQESNAGEMGEDSESDESIISTGKLPSIQTPLSTSKSFKGTTITSRRLPKRNPKRDPDEFKTLVALIKRDARSRNKDSEIEGVIGKWNSLSRY